MFYFPIEASIYETILKHLERNAEIVIPKTLSRSVVLLKVQ